MRIKMLIFDFIHLGNYDITNLLHQECRCSHFLFESLNSVIRKALKKRKIFPNDEAATKMVYLAIKDASKKWTMPIQNWRQAMSRFIIEFEERLEKHIN